MLNTSSAMYDCKSKITLHKKTAYNNIQYDVIKEIGQQFFSLPGYIVFDDILEADFHISIEQAVFEYNIHTWYVEYSQDYESYRRLNNSFKLDYTAIADDFSHTMIDFNKDNIKINTDSVNNIILADDKSQSDWPLEKLYLLTKSLLNDDIKHFITLHKRFAFSGFRIFTANYRLFGSGSDPSVTGIEDCLIRLTAAGLLNYSKQPSLYKIVASNTCIEYIYVYQNYLKIRNYIVKNKIRFNTLSSYIIRRAIGFENKSQAERVEAYIDLMIKYGFLLRYHRGNNNKSSYALLDI